MSLPETREEALRIIAADLAIDERIIMHYALLGVEAAFPTEETAEHLAFVIYCHLCLGGGPDSDAQDELRKGWWRGTDELPFAPRKPLLSGETDMRNHFRASADAALSALVQREKD